MITIDKSKCIGCGRCVEICPTQAIYLAGNEVYVREGRCRACGDCVEACPKGAITMLNLSLYPYSTDKTLRRPVGIPFRAFHLGKRVSRHRYGRRRR